MSSLRRHPNSPYWIACLTLPGGVRTNRSTKTTDRRLAQRLADDWQSAADQARHGRLVETQARAVLNDILERVGQTQLRSDTVEIFFRQWVSGKSTRGTARRYTSTVEMFLRHLGAKKSAALNAVTHEEISSFEASR